MPSTDRVLGVQLHGGSTAAELESAGLDPGDVLDFSVNVNPYGPAPSVAAAARRAALERYPDPTAAPLRDALGRELGLAPERIVVGSGSVELLWTLARALVGPRDTVFSVEPTFSEMRAAARAIGAGVAYWRAPVSAGFRVDMQAVAEAAGAADARLVYLCSPNNPTGTFVSARDVAALAAALPGAIVVLDQAFLSLSSHAPELLARLPPSVVCLRSMTKDHAIPGVRLGYLIATPELAAAVEAQRPPWTVSASAQAAGLAALSEGPFIAATRERLLADREALISELKAIGLAPLPSVTTFILVPVPDAARLRARLLRRGILIRDCSSFGLPGYVRLAARPAPERLRLVAALREELSC